MNNHEIIGLNLKLKPHKYLGEYVGYDNFPRQLSRKRGLNNDLVASVESVIYKHLGFDRNSVTLVAPSAGLAAAEILFFGDWWKDQSKYETEKEKNLEMLWYQPMHFSLFLASLLHRWDDLRKLASWCFDDHADDYFGPIGKEEPYVVMLFAEHFGGTKLIRSAELRAQVEGCRRKRPKLLLSLLDSLIAHDHDQFQDSLKQILARFSKLCPQSDIGNLWEVVDLVTSTFHNVGVHMIGLEEPELTTKLQGHLVTPHSIQ
ncbi:MAG: hypothetical protein AAF456_01995 [Planctomycetota bacterium]